MNFWQKLPKPFFVLAPMANVTDSVFRTLFAKYGKPDVTWTEFVSADGLVSPGREKLLVDLKYSPKERPIVAQLFTGKPEAMKKAAALAAMLGFDGLDINMGCPDRSVEKQGGGAAHIREPENAFKVIQAAREGVQIGIEASKFKKGHVVPVSVKTRLGYNRVDMEWLKELLELHLPALTVHLRTRKEMSDVPAHWELMPEIVKLRNEISPETLIIGNGDVMSMEEAREKAGKYGCDGVMIGRGIFGKPWFFEKEPKDRTPAERLAIMVEHTKLFEKTFGGKKGRDGTVGRGIKNFAVMKKHFKAYVNGWDGAKELRAKLMEAESAAEVSKIVKKWLVANKQ
ncbi:MAG: tRNA-dihydrouridine synthase [Candidatus Parcubacteria bacterium]|nr:tRNA-dihydrouridine synthase [Candidatus Parcubacteria bacterium]